MSLVKTPSCSSTASSASTPSSSTGKRNNAGRSLRGKARRASRKDIQADSWDKLKELELLYHQRIIDKDAYKVQITDIVNRLTDTKYSASPNDYDASAHSTESRSSSISSAIPPTAYEDNSKGGSMGSGDDDGHIKPLIHDPCDGPPPVVRCQAPNFDKYEEEEAIRHTFDFHHRRWTMVTCKVKMSRYPFDRGSLRSVYYLEDKTMNESSDSDNEVLFVAKSSIDPYCSKDVYFRDVEMQAHCAMYASLFNLYSPPRLVSFLESWIIELPNREGRPLFGVERYLGGRYQKHNNNFGRVEDERHTPQAFSHFTYEASKHKFLVVDIQGVGDIYTDPQVHTRNGRDFGEGNLGERGISKFLETHRCNAICRYLKLPPINPILSSNSVGRMKDRKSNNLSAAETGESSHTANQVNYAYRQDRAISRKLRGSGAKTEERGSVREECVIV